LKLNVAGNSRNIISDGRRNSIRPWLMRARMSFPASASPLRRLPSSLPCHAHYVMSKSGGGLMLNVAGNSRNVISDGRRNSVRPWRMRVCVSLPASTSSLRHLPSSLPCRAHHLMNKSKGSCGGSLMLNVAGNSRNVISDGRRDSIRPWLMRACMSFPASVSPLRRLPSSLPCRAHYLMNKSEGSCGENLRSVINASRRNSVRPRLIRACIYGVDGFIYSKQEFSK